MLIVYCYQKINSSYFFQIKAVHCKAGDKVGEGDIMVEIENHPEHWKKKKKTKQKNIHEARENVWKKKKKTTTTKQKNQNKTKQNQKRAQTHAQDKSPFHGFLLFQRFLRAIRQSCTYSLHIFHMQF